MSAATLTSSTRVASAARASGASRAAQKEAAKRAKTEPARRTKAAEASPELLAALSSRLPRLCEGEYFLAPSSTSAAFSYYLEIAVSVDTKTHYHPLRRLALRAGGCMLSQCATERINKVVKEVWTAKRARLLARLMRKQVFLHSNMERISCWPRLAPYYKTSEE